MKRVQAEARRKKNSPDPLFTERHEARISFGPGTERGDTEAGSPPLTIFVSSFCAHSTHTLAVQWIFNLALISCVPDETNTDSLFTFVKAPAAAGLVPHTPGDMHTKHTHAHTAFDSGLVPAGANRKSRLGTKWPWLH